MGEAINKEEKKVEEWLKDTDEEGRVVSMRKVRIDKKKTGKMHQEPSLTIKSDSVVKSSKVSCYTRPQAPSYSSINQDPSSISDQEEEKRPWFAKLRTPLKN